MTEIQQIIQHALTRYRGIRRQRAWLAALAAWVVVMALAALLDRTWMFSGWARWSGWVVGLAAAVWAARRAFGPTCPDASAIAHQVEAEAGQTAPVVATAIDPAVRLTAGDEALGGVMLDRLDRLAAEAIRVAPPTFRGRLRVPAVLAAAAVAAVVVLVVFHGGNGLLRMMIPWLASSYTSLALVGPKDALAENRAFTLTARVSGVPVTMVTLYRQGSPKPLAEAAPDPQGLAYLTVDGLTGPADFVVRGGDGQSPPLRIEPYPLPNIHAFEIVITPPAYAAHAVNTQSVPSFSVLRESRMRYRVHLKAAAESVAFERSAAPPKEERLTGKEQAKLKYNLFRQPIGIEDPAAQEPANPIFRPDPADPLVWEAVWNLSDPEDIVYRLAIKGGHGDLVRNDEPWRINVVSDTPPQVQIQSHNGAEVIRLGNETVRFKLSAVDDVRLTAARLVIRKPGQPHTRREIKLPTDAGRTWSGAESLSLAGMDVKPLDIIAVHAEAEDSNALDGPGVGRSEVVYLEVPLPESDDDGGGGGAGGGGGPPPINPLELQMEILKATIVLQDNAPTSDREAIAHDQRQNAEYVGMIEQAAEAKGLTALAAALHRAGLSMAATARVLDTQPPVKAVPDEESALGSLVEASKLLEDAKDQLQPAGEGEGKLAFTLRPPRSKSSSAKGKNDKKGKVEREALRKLMEEVQRQLAEQEKLNNGNGEASTRASQQQALAKDARSAADQAGSMQASADGRGDPKAAAEELEWAAGLQDDNAAALADGKSEASRQLGAQSAAALAKALHELAARLGTTRTDGEAYPPGYERLVGDYLRSISYE